MNFTISPGWQAKGELLMSGLAEEIGRLWQATGTVPGHLARSGPHIDDFNRVLNGLRHALTTIRALDLEVFEGSDAKQYQDLRTSDPQGQVVRGMTAPRNNAVHHPEVVDPDVARAIGPLPDGSFAIFPRWRIRDASLDPMFSHGHVFKQSYADAYDKGIAGRAVMDTVLDAFAFFDRLAPALARRAENGELRGFPLTPHPSNGAYQRLHPDWPSEPAFEAGFRRTLSTSLPTGTARVVTAAIDVDGVLVMVGWTAVGEWRQQRFLETQEQVIADIEGGYRYRVATEDGPDGVELRSDLTLIDGRALSVRALLDAGAADDERCRSLWALCCDDADFYRSMRRAR